MQRDGDDGDGGELHPHTNRIWEWMAVQSTRRRLRSGTWKQHPDLTTQPASLRTLITGFIGSLVHSFPLPLHFIEWGNVRAIWMASIWHPDVGGTAGKPRHRWRPIGELFGNCSPHRDKFQFHFPCRRQGNNNKRIKGRTAVRVRWGKVGREQEQKGHSSQDKEGNGKYTSE